MQGMDRYAYVNNSPLNYVDPSGHFGKCHDNQSGYQCRMTLTRAAQLYAKWDQEKATAEAIANARRCDNNTACSGQSDTAAWIAAQRAKALADERACERNPLCGSNGIVINPPPVTTPPATGNQTGENSYNPIKAYCGNTSTLGCISMALQDATTLVDMVGVGLIEIPLVAAGCFDGGPVGCIVGELAAAGLWSETLNILDFWLSWASTGFTIWDDLKNNGGYGENTATSVTASIAGTMAPTPSLDLAIDVYAAGYNHGFFNGVGALLNGAPLVIH